MIIHTSKRTWAQCTQWHPWFAWLPVWTGQQLRWLEWVERKLTLTGHDDHYATYRPLDLENYP